MSVQLATRLGEFGGSQLAEWTLVGNNCKYPLRPNICAPNGRIYWGCFPPGQYTIYYCGGAWNHDVTYVPFPIRPFQAPSPAWVTTLYGSGAGHGGGSDIVQIISAVGLLSFSGRLPLDPAIVASKSQFIIPPPENGWDYEAQAVASASGAKITFNHSGGLIGLYWNDVPATDNTSSDADCGSGKYGSAGSPKYGGPSSALTFAGLTATGTTCGIVSTKYQVRFKVNSICPYFGVTITIKPGGNIINPIAITQDISVGTNNITLQFDLTDESNKCFPATLSFSGGTTPAGVTMPDGWASIDYDLTPIFTVPSFVATEAIGACPNRDPAIEWQSVVITTRQLSGMPCQHESGSKDLRLTITGTDIAEVVWQPTVGANCQAQPIADSIGMECQLDGKFTALIRTTSHHPATVAATCTFSMGPCIFPPSLITIPLTWS